ncbi:hypothetical protein [Streptomyces sp. NPDC127190]|uniref:hypothetical protein n=1 Tax=unclassified Streptomyces TaxID=2593676 RepID=UPI00363D0FC4
MAVEPYGPEISVPALGPNTPNLTLGEIAAIAEKRGVSLEQCEPFAAGEVWWRMNSSKTVLSFGEDGFLEAAHHSDPALATPA